MPIAGFSGHTFNRVLLTALVYIGQLGRMCARREWDVLGVGAELKEKVGETEDRGGRLDQLSASKASKCTTHLRRCPDFSGHVAPVKVLVPQKQVYGDNVSRMIGRSIERDHSPLSPARVRHPNEHPSTSQGQPLDSHWPVCLTRTPACRVW